MLSALHNAILKKLGTINGLRTCEAYPKIRKRIEIPAVLVELAEMQTGRNPGTNRLALLTRWEARAIVDGIPPTAGLDVRNLAATVALTIFQAGNFGMSITPAVIIDVGPDEFEPELAGYETWVVSWEHEIQLGKSIWDGEGVRPKHVYIGIDPKTGEKHEPDYTQLTRPTWT